MSARGIVPMKPHCRKCGTRVERLRRCPKCGLRNWMLFSSSPWMRH
jgi:predicted  nucleic acid-binding Zn-ribbon protein